MKSHPNNKYYEITFSGKPAKKKQKTIAFSVIKKDEASHQKQVLDLINCKHKRTQKDDQQTNKHQNIAKKMIEREKDMFLEKCANLWLASHLSPTKQDSQFIVSSVIDRILQIGKSYDKIK